MAPIIPTSFKQGVAGHVMQLYNVYKLIKLEDFLVMISLQL